MERWTVLSDEVKYVQYDLYPISHYGLEVMAQEERNGTKMYKRLQDVERQLKEINGWSKF